MRDCPEAASSMAASVSLAHDMRTSGETTTHPLTWEVLYGIDDRKLERMAALVSVPNVTCWLIPF